LYKKGLELVESGLGLRIITLSIFYTRIGQNVKQNWSYSIAARFILFILKHITPTNIIKLIDIYAHRKLDGLSYIFILLHRMYKSII